MVMALFITQIESFESGQKNCPCFTGKHLFHGGGGCGKW